MSWKTVVLGDVIELQNGYAFKSSEYSDDGYFLMRITNVQQGYIQNNNPKYVNIPYKSKLQQFILNEGDILMSLTGDVGRVGVLKEENLPAALNQRVARIIIKSLLNLDEKYLFNLLNSDEIREKIESLGHGAAQLNVSTKDILSIEIPLPPLSTQKKIVAKLDSVFAEIDKAKTASEANAKNAEVLFQSYLTSVFERQNENNVLSTLGEYYDVRDGTHESPKFYESGYPLVTSKNLKNGSISFEKIQYISKEDYLSISQRSGVKKGDVLMAMIGTIGNPVVVDTDDEFAIKNVALFKTNSNQSPLFLRYYLGSDYVKRKMENDAKGATQKFVGLGYLRSFPISVPVLSSQLSIVRELEEYEQHTNRLSTSYVDKTNQLLLLRQSVLRQAFSGELVKD